MIEGAKILNDICNNADAKPYYMLWMGVLLQGVRDAADHRYRGMDWLLSNRWYPGSFVWLCELAQLDPDRARELFYKNARKIAQRSGVKREKPRAAGTAGASDV